MFVSLFFLDFSYYVNGRDTSIEDFLDPDVLDTLGVKTNEVFEVNIHFLSLDLVVACPKSVCSEHRFSIS